MNAPAVLDFKVVQLRSPEDHMDLLAQQVEKQTAELKGNRLDFEKAIEEQGMQMKPEDAEAGFKALVESTAKLMESVQRVERAGIEEMSPRLKGSLDSALFELQEADYLFKKLANPNFKSAMESDFNAPEAADEFEGERTPAEEVAAKPRTPGDPKTIAQMIQEMIAELIRIILMLLTPSTYLGKKQENNRTQQIENSGPSM